MGAGSTGTGGLRYPERGAGRSGCGGVETIRPPRCSAPTDDDLVGSRRRSASGDGERKRSAPSSKSSPKRGTATVPMLRTSGPTGPRGCGRRRRRGGEHHHALRRGRHADGTCSATRRPCRPEVIVAGGQPRPTADPAIDGVLSRRRARGDERPRGGPLAATRFSLRRRPCTIVQFGADQRGEVGAVLRPGQGAAAPDALRRRRR